MLLWAVLSGAVMYAAARKQEACPAGVQTLLGRTFEIDFASDTADLRYTIVVGTYVSLYDKSQGRAEKLGNFSGLEQGSTHRYTGGEACEFEERSSMITFQCGATLDVVEAADPTACAGRIVVETPYCCAEGSALASRRKLAIGASLTTAQSPPHSQESKALGATSLNHECTTPTSYSIWD